MTTTTYESEFVERGYQSGEFENVTVRTDAGYEYTVTSFVGRIDYVKLGNAGGNSAHKDYNSAYSVIEWLGEYEVSVWLNRADVDHVTKTFYNLKDAVDFYLSFKFSEICEKVIYQARQLYDGSRDWSVVRYA